VQFLRRSAQQRIGDPEGTTSHLIVTTLEDPKVLSSRARIYIVLSSFFWASAIVLIAVQVSLLSGFDGVIVNNLNGRIGPVKHGQTFQHVIRMYNISPVSASVSALPGCGCAVDKSVSYVIPAWSRVDIPVRYLALDPTKGRKVRDVLLDYRHGGFVRNLHGTISYTQR